MKYCPYCGASLVDSAVSFCSECGKELPPSKPEETAKPKEAKVKKNTATPKMMKKKKPKAKEAAPDPPVSDEPKKEDDAYDGYYDDIIPGDIGKHREGIDWKLMKRIGLVAAGVLVIISLCVAAMYLL